MWNIAVKFFINTLTANIIAPGVSHFVVNMLNKKGCTLDYLKKILFPACFKCIPYIQYSLTYEGR